MKKIVQVLEAVQSGAETTTEIAAITGLPNNSCCAHLHRLKAMGLVGIAKKHAVKYSERGHWSHIWKLTKGEGNELRNDNNAGIWDHPNG